ncbi:Uncharacterized protein dnm_009730 [Desulfonema magnum]|uniref:Uncharacterized protein n=1 Tax=Desulfonema magnum TaxID=45655 RepID=A0A975BGV0_9BACT|nr:Uncharacterized protein dnm_009730 [Desulfonema magnum]
MFPCSSLFLQYSGFFLYYHKRLTFEIISFGKRTAFQNTVH